MHTCSYCGQSIADLIRAAYLRGYNVARKEKHAEWVKGHPEANKKHKADYWKRKGIEAKKKYFREYQKARYHRKH